jgi:hypothetical protein
MRKPFIISRLKEAKLTAVLIQKIKRYDPDLDPTNTLVLMVSPDYSASVAMHVAHGLSKDGEMCDLLHIPDPDATPAEVLRYQERARKDLLQNMSYSDRIYKNYLLVEAGVIRGGTFTWLTEMLKKMVGGEIITAALCENKRSAFKSNVVATYYDDQTQDLTFHFEQPNKHWT